MILQKVIETSKATILVIGGLPKDPEIVLSGDGKIFYCDHDQHDQDAHIETIPAGEWQPLGFLKDITEDVAREIVDFNDCPDSYLGRVIFYRKYPHELHEDFCDTAIESLYSLIESNCKLKNKCGEIPDEKDKKYQGLVSWENYYKEDIKGWHNEQSQVFTNPFLLKKV